MGLEFNQNRQPYKPFVRDFQSSPRHTLIRFHENTREIENTRIQQFIISFLLASKFKIVLRGFKRNNKQCISIFGSFRTFDNSTN